MRRPFMVCGATAALICATAVLIANAANRRPSTVQNAEESLADLTSLALAALSSDRATADEAIGRLRDAGQAGLDALIEVHRDQSRGNLQQWEAAVDRVSGQRYGHISRLFWYTSLDRAVDVAPDCQSVSARSAARQIER